MTTYPTDLSNNQWQIISKNFDTERKRKYDLREITNGILYLVKIRLPMANVAQRFCILENSLLLFFKLEKVHTQPDAINLAM